MNVTVATYLRISNEDGDLKQAGKSESNSIANQRSLLADFISHMPEFGDAEILEFCDDGFSGRNFERPAVREMLEKVKQGKIRCIVVKDLSRFGRDYLSVGNYLSRVFPFLNVRFIAVNDGFDSIRQTDIDSLETSFKTLLSDLYSRDLSQKVRQAKRFRAEQGDFLSPFAPYGYRKNPCNRNQLTIDPEAAGVVRRIFQMAADGYGTLQIARTLNEEQVPTPMQYKRAAGCSRTEWPSVSEENFWTHTTVTGILRDERYTGKNIYGKKTRDEIGKAHVVKVPRADWVTVEGTHEGIVTCGEFDCAQAQLRAFMERSTAFPGRKGTVLYKKVRCGICGHTMTRMAAKQPYYICHTPHVISTYACMEGRIPESDLLETVLAGLRVQASYAVEASVLWEERRRRIKYDANAVSKSISSLKETLAGLESHILELYEGFALGELDKAGYLTLKSTAIKKRDAISARIQELEAQLQNTNAQGRLENQFADHFKQYAEVEELTQEIVSDVLQEIIVYPDKMLNIVWNYQEDLKQLLLDANSKESTDSSL